MFFRLDLFTTLFYMVFVTKTQRMVEGQGYDSEFHAQKNEMKQYHKLQVSQNNHGWIGPLAQLAAI